MIKNNWQYLLFDGDVTLIDFRRSYNEALNFAINKIPKRRWKIPEIFVEFFKFVIFSINEFGLVNADETKLNFSNTIISLMYLNFNTKKFRYDFWKKFVSLDYEIQGSKKLLKDLKEAGYIIVLVSNNSQNERFAKDNNILDKYIYVPSLKFKATKPLLTKLFLEENNVESKECLFIGDSYRDDIFYAKKCDVKSVLIKKKINTFMKWIFKPNYCVKNLNGVRRLLL